MFKFIRTAINNIFGTTPSGKVFQFSEDHPKYAELQAAIEAGDEVRLFELLNIGKAIKKWAKGLLTFEGGYLRYKGVKIDPAIQSRIFELIKAQEDVEPMRLFLENLFENPSEKSLQQVYQFLVHKGLPLTDDGHFLAQKAVTSDFLDKHSRTIDNSVGQVITMDRHLIDDDQDTHCSRGLHAGSMDYVSTFGGSGDKIVIVEINPRDVVCVPNDANCQKLRCCRYEVVGIHEGIIQQPVIHQYSDSGYDSDFDDEDSDDYEEEYYDCGMCEDVGCSDCDEYWFDDDSY